MIENRRNELKKYLSKINIKEIKEATEKAIDNLPDYFFSVPASSGGKYHPSFNLGDGGLFRHSCFCVDIILELFNIYTLTEEEKSIIVSALILHDGKKHGEIQSKHTVKSHPIIMANWLRELWKDEMTESLNQVINAISSHMGFWNTSENGNMPTPQTKIEKFVHLGDYLGSRKIYDNYYKGEVND